VFAAEYPMDGFSPPAVGPADPPHTMESLFRRYGRWLRGVLQRRYGDVGEDLTQEAVLRVAARRDEIEHPKAFLLTVADNLARDEMRKTRRETSNPHVGEALSAQSNALDLEQALLLKQIVLALPPELRDVLVLTKIKGMSYHDAAQLLGIPERRVKDRVRQALAKASAAMRD